MISGEVRKTSVRAMTECKLQGLDRRSFFELQQEHPDLKDVLLGIKQHMKSSDPRRMALLDKVPVGGDDAGGRRNSMKGAARPPMDKVRRGSKGGPTAHAATEAAARVLRAEQQ